MNMMIFIPELIFTGFYTGSLIWFCIHILHIFQLEEYQSQRLINWGLKSRRNLFKPPLILASIISLVLVATATIILNSVKLNFIITSLLCFIATVKAHQGVAETKKSLVYTSRAKRILFAASLVALIVSILSVIFLEINDPIIIQSILNSILILITPFLALFCVLIGNLFLTPIESIIKLRYEQSARKILKRNSSTKIVGITGSYGKTTTKFITNHLLSSKYKTLPTPQSYNTFMGIIRVIREDLKPFHEIFIVEMGAYIPGEIKKICGLVHPDISIITDIGPQHLERFGTVENVARAKYEIVQGLPQNGTLIIYADNPLCSFLADRAKSEGYNVLKYGVTTNNSLLDAWASDINYSSNGTSFQLHIKGSISREVEIPLLGYHNVLNVLASTLVASQFDISLDDIVQNCSSIPPTPHRLQLINSGNGITIIDDSYNSNIIGVHNTLDLLEKIAVKGKIIVTPGIIELGKIEYTENYRFGEHIAKVCSHAILVGMKQTKPIQEGLLSCDFPRERLIVVSSLKEATLELGKITCPGDTVLFSNDLPDNYTE